MELKGKLVMLFNFNFEMLLSGMVHLLGGRCLLKLYDYEVTYIL